MKPLNADSQNDASAVHEPVLDRRGEGVSALLAAAFPATAAALFFLADFLHSLFVSALAWQFMLAAVPAVCAFLQFRVFRRADERKRGEELLKERVKSESLFEHLANVSPHQRLRSLKKALTLSSDILLFLFSAGLMFHFFSQEISEPGNAAPGLAFCGIVAFCAYTGGKYLAALGQQQPWHPVAVTGKWSGCCGILAFAGVVAFGAAHAGWPQACTFLDRLVPFWFLLSAVDKLCALFGRIYGLQDGSAAPGRSLPVETVGAPGDALRSVNEALSYNFGIHLTAAASGRFLVGIVCPFFLVSFLVFVVLSCAGWIEPGRAGVVERLGRRSGPVKPPGFFLKLPWPFETVRIVDSSRVRSEAFSAHGNGVNDASFGVNALYDGSDSASADRETRPGGASDSHEEHTVVLWSKEHGDKYFIMTPTWGKGEKSVGLLAVSATVFFNVNKPADYLYRSVDPDRITRLMFKSELIRRAAETDPEAFFDHRRKSFTDAVAKDLNRALSAYGVTVRNVFLQHVHMPVEAAPAFEEVASSRAKRKAVVLGAEAERLRLKRIIGYQEKTLLYKAQARAAGIKTNARRLKLRAEAVAPWWPSFGDVLKNRFVMETFRSLGKGREKIVLPPNAGGRSVFEIRPGEAMFFSEMNGEG